MDEEEKILEGVEGYKYEAISAAFQLPLRFATTIEVKSRSIISL